VKKIIRTLFQYFRRLLTLPFRLSIQFLNWLFCPVIERIQQGRIYHFFSDIPEERPALDAFNAAVEHPKEILEHLDEIRRHLGRALFVLTITTVISFYFANDMLYFLSSPIGGLENLQAIEVTEPIAIFMRVALFAGIALASPYVAFELWLYVAPGLMPKARLMGLFAIPATLVFFLGGAAFAYFVMLPTALPFLLGIVEVDANLRPSSYVSFVTGLMFWIGIAFQFPLIILALSGMGLIKPQMLLRYWRIAIVVIAILSAAITPTIDPVNMALVMLPMTALYFLSIFFSWIANLSQGNKTFV
jgi:sec-independent protein translocase protein TatC